MFGVLTQCLLKVQLVSRVQCGWLSRTFSKRKTSFVVAIGKYSGLASVFLYYIIVNSAQGSWSNMRVKSTTTLYGALLGQYQPVTLGY
jgi:hypothetical protein